MTAVQAELILIENNIEKNVINKCIPVSKMVVAV